MQDLTQPANSECPSIDPFADDVFTHGSPIPGTPQIHEEEMTFCLRAIEKMMDRFEDPSMNQDHGRVLSIFSPRAGYGKSHLIGRLLKTTPEPVHSIDLSFGTGFCWNDLFTQAIRQLDSRGSALQSGLSLLDETAAFFLSHLVREAISQSAIEEKDCPVFPEDLESDYRAIFTEKGRSKFKTWLKKKCPVFRNSVCLLNSEFSGFSKDDTVFWTDYFYDHLRGEKTGSPAHLSESEARERCLQLLRIASLSHPLLIIADHLDCCHGSPASGMEIASALTAIAENVPYCVLLLSINRDLWDSVFREELPTALIDRLSGENLELSSLGLNEAKELLINRLCSCGVNYHESHRFASELADDRNWAGDSELFPRRILRDAKRVWRIRHREYYQPEFHQNSGAEMPEDYGDVDSELPGTGIHHQDEITKDLPFSEPKSSRSPNVIDNPFEGNSMTYSDRSGTNDPVPQFDENSFSHEHSEGESPPPFPPQQSPDNLQAGRIDADQLPLDGDPQHPAARHKDEPDIRPPAGAPHNPVNGKTNGHSAKSKPATLRKRSEEDQSADPLDQYFGELEKHYRKKGNRLRIDFPTLESLIQAVGKKHTPLTQNELSIPGGESSCLRWALSDYAVWISFEPTRNTHFFSNILQKLLSDHTCDSGKIVGFSHVAEPYREELLAANGITPDILKRYFDFIQLNSAELVMISSAARFLKETTEKGYEEEGHKFIVRKLNPLWQRLCHPIEDPLK